MAIQVGSVEVDVVPNTQHIYTRLRAGLTAPAERVGTELGNIIGRSVAASVSNAVRDGIRRGGQQATGAASRQGGDAGGAFGRNFRTRVEAAFRSLPDIVIGADTSDADSEIRALRSQLERLSTQRVGIDVDAAAARQQIEAVERDLQRLGASSPDVAVRANTAAAVAELAALRAQIDAVDGREVTVRADASVRSFGMLVTAAAAFGPAILPVLPLVAAGLGAVAAAGAAAAVGVGAVGLVAAPGITGIANALAAQKAAQDAATTSALRGGQASSRGASSALQLAGAQQALASAHRNAARQITQAEQAVDDAVREAAEANDRAARQVKTAKRDLAEAVQQAADRQQAAAEAVARAEQSLADAQRTARQAQQDLTQARKDAAAELAELGDRLIGAQLAERDAALAVKEAEERLREVQKNGSKATLLEQERAQLAYDQAVERLRQQQAETKGLAEEKAAADKAGVEGSDTVRQAQERVREADRGIVEQQGALQKARTEAARQQVQSQQDIAEAQEKVAESQRAVTRVQEDGARSVARAQESLVAAQQSAADSIASAQRQIASAQQSAASAAVGTIDQAAVAQAKFAAELAKLSPSARATYNAFVSLRTAFKSWSEALQPAVMPLFTRALEGLKNALPGLTPIVLAAATAIANLQDRASRGFKSPWWKGFKADFTGSVQPAIEGLGIAFGNVFKGMAGVLQAFFPHMDGISSRMQTITERFADWGSSLKGSPAFERFLAFSADKGPFVAELLGNLFGAMFDVGMALAPLAGTATSFLNALADGISAIPVNVLTVIAVAFTSIAIGAKLAAIALGIWRLAVIAAGLVTAIMTGQVWALNAAMRANLIGIIITAILALVVAIVYAYQNSETFRDIVQTVFKAVAAAAVWLWETILKPVFDAIVVAFQAVATAAIWLWDNILKPVFGFIGDAAALLATIILTVLIAPIVIAFKGLAVVAEWLWKNVMKPTFEGIAQNATWLWTNVLSPVFGFIAEKAKWLWENAIRPMVDRFKRGLQELGDKANWVWEKVLRPVFGWIGDKAGWLWKNAISPAFSNIKSGVQSVADSFEKARGFIEIAWNKVADITKKPVRFVIDKVYNGGIVPTWNMIAKAFGAPEIKSMKTEGWATGGVLPGYTPGRDVHKFVSPTGGGLELSGGEAIMRPEWTRAVGAGFVNTMNAIARTRGLSGVKAALAPSLGGSAPVATDRTLKYADGGIFDWIGDKAAGAGTAVWNGVKSGAKWLADGVEQSARAGLNGVVNPLLSQFPGADTNLGRMLKRIPTKIVDSIFGYSKEADKKGAGGVGGPRVQKALSWARTQNGLPYQWGGNGNPSWDCSGFMSAIESVIRGQEPHRRWATGAFNGKTAPPGWVLNGKSPFMIGITNAGVGHTAGTIGGVNVESRGGDGVVVGPRARSYKDSLFTDVYGFQPGTFDSGGYLQPGLNLAYNGTGRPEPVFTTVQANALTRMANQGGGLQPGDALTLVVQDGPTLRAYVQGEAGAVVAQHDQSLVMQATAGKRY
ncbi:hypothetical protein ABT034_33415 [Streptomyces sp. NPDC002773]|uniref:hypothetical protein n=1 Tax=Streptomyces sp. NPDC002773 TaxID=3154430 RepID=UPI00331D819B